MNRRRLAVFGLALMVIGGLTLSCRGKEPGQTGTGPGQPKHDQAVYARETPESKDSTFLAADLSAFAHPTDPLEFTQIFHLPPVMQGKTGTCWSFAATSLLESELRRQGKAVVKLSEMHTVYWEYVEKARRFLREKGNSFLGQGSEPNSALARIKQYGLVRESDYPGLLDGRTSHDHGPLFRELRDHLAGLAAKNTWDETSGLAGVRAILDRHLGRPPDRIDVDGRSLTPLEYLASLGLVPDDYVSFVSFMYLPFYTQGEYKVPDNWWHSGEYRNLPLYEIGRAHV
jgi:bleomycin hydrolase